MELAGITGTSDEGTWARIPEPPSEGEVRSGRQGLDMADRVRVKLLSAGIERGNIAAMGGLGGEHVRHGDGNGLEP